ncbi:hypothetical protein A0257_14525 [Hymenobacter psoromatis]|nr:hypothetical protein A0257_14525 [Hymenobacter psoromatis]
MSRPDTALDHHDRTEFQLERLILFTDAVFAIAITLLAIEIRFPEFKHSPSNADIWRGMGELLVVLLLPSHGLLSLLIPFTPLLTLLFMWLHRRRHMRLPRTHLALRQPAELAPEPGPVRASV